MRRIGWGRPGRGGGGGIARRDPFRLFHDPIVFCEHSIIFYELFCLLVGAGASGEERELPTVFTTSRLVYRGACILFATFTVRVLGTIHCARVTFSWPAVIPASHLPKWRHYPNMKTRCFLSLWTTMVCLSQLSK